MKEIRKKTNLLLLLILLKSFISSIKSFQSNIINSKRANKLYKNKIIFLSSSNNNNIQDPASVSSILLQNNENMLNNAFELLSETDKYDAVLTGICAKLLESKATATLEEEQVRSQVMPLLQEMQSRKIEASERCISAVMDVITSSQNSVLVADGMSLLIRMKRDSLETDQATSPLFISRYGKLQPSILTKKKKENLPEIPLDERAKEISSALLFISWMSGTFIISNSVGSGVLLIDPTFYSSSNLFATFCSLGFTASLAVIVLDNFYGILKTGMSTLNKDISFPSELPFNIGSGQFTSTITQGMVRLLSSDSERECQCEATALYTAYGLGLPCFAFKPNALQAAILLFESSLENEKLDSLLSTQGILKLLTWIMSPVAMEAMKYPVCIVSDYREGFGFLNRIREKCTSFDVSLERVEECLEENDEILVRMAYQQAIDLINENKNSVEILTERLLSGAATVGDCVAVIEDW